MKYLQFSLYCSHEFGIFQTWFSSKTSRMSNVEIILLCSDKILNWWTHLLAHHHIPLFYVLALIKVFFCLTNKEKVSIISVIHNNIIKFSNCFEIPAYKIYLHMKHICAIMYSTLKLKWYDDEKIIVGRGKRNGMMHIRWNYTYKEMLVRKK